MLGLQDFEVKVLVLDLIAPEVLGLCTGGERDDHKQ
jgi:hypothetical protein